ncbi:Hypothetical protein A7982_10328 [Minicystis rosea]|nr:Hypothetical protein A7982_10328 [Minicystis rosea]
MSLTRRALVSLLFLAGCSESATTPDGGGGSLPERQPNARAPLTAPCDDMDPTRCLLPWPSNTFTVADANTKTGLRVKVEKSSLIAPDDPSTLSRADGFSRVTPIVAGFAAAIGPIADSSKGDGPVRLIAAQKDQASFGQAVPLRFDVRQGTTDQGTTESMVFGYPLRPLEANTDYVGVVLDDLPADGAKLEPSRPAQIALGLIDPTSLDEQKLAAYHAPTRALLEKAGIDAHHVLRVWDFTTRSAEDPTHRLEAMRKHAQDEVSSGAASVVIEKVDLPSDSPIAAIVEGHLEGLPSYIGTEETTELTLDAQDMPMIVGTRSAPFRVVIPAGTGSYPFVMFGHGTGGSYEDDTFDSELATAGVAKVSIQFYGWNGNDVLKTFVGFTHVFQGASHAAALLMQALTDGAGVQISLSGALGQALSAPTLGGKPNPAAGRMVDTSTPMWVGGSLGGIMGLVAAGASPEVHYGMLNVPGAAWTHFVPTSLMFAPIKGLLNSPYQGELNALHAVTMAQLDFDEIDGASWVDALAKKNAVFLIQESVGDPVVPNPGSAMVAVVTGADQVGAVISPMFGVTPVSEADGKSGITQYLVPDTDGYDIHGFAARNTPAGNAARDQIIAFGASVYAGAPKITAPPSCTGGSCDFSKKP